ncbi:hypothetical protein BN946_scf184842.g7 [Trametes cinnabarina]|uniref:Uncharacterized protein n=1 Tax=Pycnoporus cinnabarinus TaxID=5643 RepID=A0A060S7I3_PYCCI|nr:hypothetical protein BN946_scf184842.g7 [Trametes cinnabarina]
MIPQAQVALHASVASTLAGSKDPLVAASSSSIPWTIVNKYYTAEVHFETHDFEHFRVHHAIGVPAIIYVWGPGEPYKEHIPEIAQKIQHYDPEVTLAVRFSDSAINAVSATSPTEEEDGLDEFLSSHGFEFVEGDRSYRRPTQDAERHSDDEDSGEYEREPYEFIVLTPDRRAGIPGLPRVIDALSTIMWPSLVQSQSTRQRKSRARELVGWAIEEEGDEGLRALIADPSASTDAHTTDASIAENNVRKSRMQREMEELERWLEDKESGSGLQYARSRPDGRLSGPPVTEAERDQQAEAWVTSAPVTSVEGWEDILTPPAIRTPRADDDPVAALTAEHGFEDDFADFVSGTSDAHLLHPHGLGHGEDRLLEVSYDVARLTPMHTGASYRSMTSVSDFGGEEGLYVERDELQSGGYGVLGEDDNDPDLPSRAEILETSRRLFGAAVFAAAPEAGTATAATSSSSFEPATAPPTSEPSVSTSGSSAANPDLSADLSLDSEEGDDDHSFAPFDLSRVFSALQGMKAEIAGMENEDERRRAAARVALGLVYGLGVQNEGGEREISAGPAPQA